MGTAMATVSPAVTGLLEKVEAHSVNNPDDWSAWDMANIREMRRIQICGDRPA